MPMRLAWGLVLVLLSVTAIHAKDLPRSQSEPKSTGCEWAGQGFAKVEGSSTCVKVGGLGPQRI